VICQIVSPCNGCKGAAYKFRIFLSKVLVHFF
jgi:hypothetical protein